MTDATAGTLERGKRRTAVSMVMLVTGMVCLGYASVPLYRLFCQVTGFGGTTQRAEAGAMVKPVAGKTISIRFDANHAPALPWSFEPEKHVETVTIGANEMAFYSAKNLSDKPVSGIASYNVSPTQAGKYFTKVECFCFSQQTLEPGQQVRMPVIFFVDPKILDDPDANDISEITLSYTFFPVDPEKG
ncbi:cytochrome c oxidase assembly protein [Sphingomonas colocasiae]|uniref:Cytochrome c oxidase assembly protein CtaG n=1 Tax=Sphingomonas colocasiae TaxID=1848973 RepID=A0ABS7PYI0_9SPHN|nr:cytochrome c oxidase assembly protein [Sphingomonas colocasiae]MBY8825392.1 cytochrome c oxidase assembly protein [Sphingomonas colocasiae]